MRALSLLTSIIGYLLGPVVLLLAALLISLQSVAGNQRLFDRQAKALSRLIPMFFGIRVRTCGRENFDPGKALVFMANHVNIFDPIILYGRIPNFVRAVELESHFSWPVWGFIIRRLGNIPISHTNVARALESLEAARKAVLSGTSIGILPEGHRTRNGHLGPFKRGAFRFAKAAGTDIVPIALRGLWERKTVHSLRVIPGTVELIFGAPVTAGEAASMSERELRDLVSSRIAGLLENGTPAALT